MERLQKYLASCGVASRRTAEQLIGNRRVTVNGQVVAELGRQIEPDVDSVEVDGHPVRQPAKVYLALNKPRGVVSTTSDPWGRQTVASLVPSGERLFPVGRLDADSEGLVLMTNDGELANRLMHPRYGCEKEYRAMVRGNPTPQVLAGLRRGIELSDGRTARAEVEPDHSMPGERWLHVVLREGRKRQVRRMLAAVGLTVERLQRVRIGSLELGKLELGKSRALSGREVARLERLSKVGSA